MLAVIYIDPAICHTWLGYLVPECYGIAVCTGLSLSLALAAAVALKRVRRLA